MKKSNKCLPKKLRVMADYGSSGIWVMEPVGPFRHGMIRHGSLGLPKELSSRFDEWIRLYWKRTEETPFDVNRFNQIGKALARELKQFAGPDVYIEFQPELPDGGLGSPEVILQPEEDRCD
jgi:hypothetical protein